MLIKTVLSLIYFAGAFPLAYAFLFHLMSHLKAVRFATLIHRCRLLSSD